MNSITMTREQVQAAIAGHDLKTFKGWTAAAVALLADKPAGTAIKDSEVGFMTLIDGSLCALPVNRDGSTRFETENGVPLEGCDPDESAWSERGCWDCSEPEHDLRTLTEPVFVTLTFVEV